MNHRPLTDRSELERLFEELATELKGLGLSADVVMIGGSWMLWHSHRASTWDVDSGRRLVSGAGEAIERVGERHGLDKRWLNDRAAAFWPANATYGECETVFEHEALVVRVPSAKVVFVMKLYRAHPQDREDLISLWPSCGFADPGEAATAFWSAYPHAPDDEFLAEFIAVIAGEATDT